MSGLNLNNPNQDRSYYMNKSMSSAASSTLNNLVAHSEPSAQRSNPSNSHSRREFATKQNHANHTFAKNTNNSNGSSNNNNNHNNKINDNTHRQPQYQQQNNNNSNNHNNYNNANTNNSKPQSQQQQQPQNSYRSQNNNQFEQRKQSPYCRERKSDEQSDAGLNKTKAIQKQYKTLKLSKKFNLSDNIRKQQLLRVNINCFQNKFSKVNNNLIPTLPKFLMAQTSSVSSLNLPHLKQI